MIFLVDLLTAGKSGDAISEKFGIYLLKWPTSPNKVFSSLMVWGFLLIFDVTAKIFLGLAE